MAPEERRALREEADRLYGSAPPCTVEDVPKCLDECAHHRSQSCLTAARAYRHGTGVELSFSNDRELIDQALALDDTGEFCNAEDVFEMEQGSQQHFRDAARRVCVAGAVSKTPDPLKFHCCTRLDPVDTWDAALAYAATNGCDAAWNWTKVPENRSAAEQSRSERAGQLERIQAMIDAEREAERERERERAAPPPDDRGEPKPPAKPAGGFTSRDTLTGMWRGASDDFTHMTLSIRYLPPSGLGEIRVEGRAARPYVYAVKVSATFIDEMGSILFAPIEDSLAWSSPERIEVCLSRFLLTQKDGILHVEYLDCGRESFSLMVKGASPESFLYGGGL